MSLHQLKIVQTLPVSIQTAWDFFSDPNNLQLITPASFRFKILTDLGNRAIHEGQVIEYKVRPLFNIEMYWRTVITRVQDKVMFIDEQQKGPYRYWQHQHHFKAVADGTEMTDIVKYEVPGWFAGDILHSLLISKKLKDLFQYRYDAISKLMSAKEFSAA